MMMALALLIGLFYILNIEYPSGTRNAYAFLEAQLFDKSEAQKRISVQKLLKEFK